ncbi:hypothetical protein PYCCODRAFT_1440872 [Trametes coccinea BRFM310]|uniref:Uncharacterized protein n=1 Tax=Trametes coccinea (strain BRFM310) TaxID=1353009 RepID=A0A1Y2I8L6_TRAC3|nr:hypothetical protein PYCCODRAFT_1440872 [Trametes coccinea BRFM310]
MSSNVASESQQATCIRTLRGGYPFTPEQGQQIATALAGMVNEAPPDGVDDFPSVLYQVDDLLSRVPGDLGFQRVWNKNVPNADYVYFLATTRRHYVKLPQEEMDRARAEKHYFDPSVQLVESDADRYVKQIVQEETGVEGGPFHTVIWVD